MTIEVNNVFPNQDLRLIVDGELKQVNSSEYLADKKIILVGVPGAFTPCLLYTSPSPRDLSTSRMPSSA